PPTATLETPQSPLPTPTSSMERTPGWEAQIESPLPGRESGSPTLGSARPPGYVANPSPWPPPARIEPPPPKLQIDKPPQPAPRPTGVEPTSLRDGPVPLTQSPTSSKKPYCNLEGNQLKSFAVRDLSGQLYEFRRDQHPKLVLLQFWHTTC